MAQPTIPPWIQTLQQRDPQFAESYLAQRERILQDGAIPAEYKILMTMIVDAITAHADGVANIANRARAGRSSRSYYNEGLWANVLAEMKPGDFVLIQMGHNDGGGDPANDAKARSSVKGIGDDTAEYLIPKPFTTGPIAGQTRETVHSYGWYLRKYINDTRAKKATPILLTITIRNIWAHDADGNLRIERDMGFRDYEYQIAASENVPVIDMATVEADRLDALGPEKTALLFPIDHTHTSAEGAERNAESVVIALRNSNSPLTAYLKPD